MHRKHDFLLNFIESQIFLWGVVCENSFERILENTGLEWKFLFRYFSHFLSCLLLGLAEMTALLENFLKKISLYNFRKTMFRKSGNFWPGIESKDFQV